MDPGEQIRAMLSLEEDGWDLVAIYHSHPTGTILPSKTDVDEAFYPEAVQIIWGMEDNAWVFAAFLIQDGIVERIKIEEIIS
jgi:proteasome lid subunit RPN8/RPN11